MFRIAVCDDDRTQLCQLSEYIKEYTARNAARFEVRLQCFENGADLLAAHEKGERFQVILLDIIMPLISGIETAQEIRELDKVAKIVFLTASPEYALDSYKVKAFSYLLKSSSKEELFRLFDEAINELAISEAECIVVRSRAGLIKLYFHSLEYVEVDRRTVYYHLSNGGVIETFGSFHELEQKLLMHKQFIKPHRSFIVNMEHIKEISNSELRTVSGSRIPVPRASFSRIKDVYFRYSFRGCEQSV